MATSASAIEEQGKVGTAITGSLSRSGAHEDREFRFLRIGHFLQVLLSRNRLIYSLIDVGLILAVER